MRDICREMAGKLKMANLLENLNERQIEAVLETEGYVRVIAGAGSGKTKLLVSRYAYLVQDYGIDSGNILCVTFTNKAAGEMKRRIRGLIGEGNDVSLICTYHGFCNKLLRENPEKLFLNKQFQIIDSHQQKGMLEEIYQKHELKLDYAAFETMLRKIGRAKKDMEYVRKMCDPKPCRIMSKIEDQDDQIIEEFLQRQKATYSLDFHDLIAFAIYLLETDSQVRQKWQSRLNYIMVDEFQDSSSVEMRLVEILSGMYRNLMIVGDPDQNIYEWRGSDVKLLVDFDKQHEPTKTIILNQNYRSTPQILQCANALIEKNQVRLKKDLFTRNPEGAPVVHYHSRNETEEMDQVIDNIRRLREKEGFRYSDFAIIYRASFLSRVMEKKLVEKNVPYEIFGGVRFYQRAVILDVLAYLKLIAYGDDNAFLRVVNLPRRRFGRGKVNRLEELREQEKKGSFYQESLLDLTEEEADGKAKTLFATLSEHLGDREFAGSDAGPFVRFMEDMRSGYRDMRISDIVNRVMEGSGYENYIRSLGDEERLDNLAEFKRIANEFEREFGEDLSLEEFLQQIALQAGEDRDESKDAVKLMTIHSSKGLEFPVVFILGFTEGVFPSAKTLGDRKMLGLEEERRLCYVAITRAERYLYLMDSEGMSENGIKNLASRFLEEIGEKNYVRIGKISEELRQESKRYAEKLNLELLLEPAGSRKVGDVVEHHVFGAGVIEAIDAKRGSYSVKFEKLPHPRNISSSYFGKKHEDILLKNPISQTQAAQAHPEDAGARGSWDPKGRGGSRDAKGQPGSEEPDGGAGPVSGGTEGHPKALEDMAEESGPVSGDWEAPLEIEMIEKDVSDGEREEEGTFAVSAAFESELKEKSEEEKEREEKAARLRAWKENSPNLWKRSEVPHFGWSCVGVEDLGSPSGICEMCGYQIIRYAHQMEHPSYPSLSVGCKCAGKMEGDVSEAKRREADFKNRQSRRMNFFKRQWKRSKKGNEYLKIDGHVVVIYHDDRGKGSWRYSLDNEFCRTVYADRERAVAGVFEALEGLRAKG